MTKNKWPCPGQPEALAGQPIGMYHCEFCGEMQLAGSSHLPPQFPSQWEPPFPSEEPPQETKRGMNTANFTTDTRKDHCPIYIVYSSTHPATGPVPTTELSDRSWVRGVHPLAVIKATEHSDYSGTTTEVSNYICLQELSVKHPSEWPLIEIYGARGYQALAYDATLGPVPPTWGLCNALDGFENHYPIFDDDHHNMLEAELELEEWDEHGNGNFRKHLEKTLDTVDPDFKHILPDDDATTPSAAAEILATLNSAYSRAVTWKTLLWDLWRSGCEILNINNGSGYVIKAGCLVHFHIDAWFGRLDGVPSGRATQIDAIISSLALATRITS